MSNFLHVRKSGDDFERIATGFPTYKAAVECGLDIAGPRNFFVETSGAPTREEQLLLPPATKRKKFDRRNDSTRGSLSTKERSLLDSLNL